MFDKVVQKIYNWSYSKLVKKQQAKTKNKEFEKNKKFYKHFKDLYEFVKWLNTKLPDRRVRKQFWNNVKDGKPVIENTLQNLMNDYRKKLSDVKITVAPESHSKPVKKGLKKKA